MEIRIIGDKQKVEDETIVVLFVRNGLMCKANLLKAFEINEDCAALAQYILICQQKVTEEPKCEKVSILFYFE